MAGMLRNELANRVDAARERLIDITRRLVAVASPNPPSDTYEVAQVAEALLREIPAWRSSASSRRRAWSAWSAASGAAGRADA